MNAGRHVVESVTTSMRQLAAELDVSYATVRGWASGRRRPGRRNRARLAELARDRAYRLLALAAELDGGRGWTRLRM